MQTLPQRYLLIGDETDLPLLRAMLEGFPAKAAGNVLLEMPDGISPQLPLPRGMMLSHLHRGGFARGERAAEALEAWVQEWTVGEHAAPDMHAIWVGLEGCDLIDLTCDRLARENRDLHLHRPWVDGCEDGEHQGAAHHDRARRDGAPHDRRR